MNTAAYHVSEELLEGYAMGKLSDQVSAPLEEHLLLCQLCCKRLHAMDEFVGVVKAALTQARQTSPKPKLKRARVHTA